MTGGNTLNRPKTVSVHLQTVLVWYDAFDWQYINVDNNEMYCQLCRCELATHVFLQPV